MRLISALRGAMAIAPVFAGQAAGQAPDPREIVRRAFDRPDNLFEGQRNFTYLKRSVIKQFDGSGQITKQEIETSEVMVLYGRPYSRLVARDDKPLSAEESRDEQAKMDKEMRKRKAEGNSRKRTEEDRGRQAGREVADAFHFRLVRMESTQAGEAYVIDATPRLDYEAKSRQAKMFRQMTARLWIERAGFRFVRGKARVIDTVSFGWFLFRLQPGAVFEIDQVMVDGVLLPRHVHVKGQARIAGLKVLRIEMEISFSDYKRFQVDSKVLAQ